ncbi:hypothetical protein CNMCM5793_007724 [Aspergillus hiratsukae]|uniref:Uncharacterized protein n=1 Tax=Aspergillus hiratsukae TaxID=1194566 RepID=A0A8H6PQD0_9EURO|nr:hypothetical protein CNMCM5793_007724 [Aspergillus hiratsukae]KAF7159030.1 hypothetical protein CNMCM6106_006123 [Aspergillus hiratsukae]
MLKTVAFDFRHANATVWGEGQATRCPNAALTPLFYQITHSSTWFEYEKGLILKEESHKRLADELGVPKLEISNAIEALPHLSLAPGLTALQAEFPSVQFIAVGNISPENMACLQIREPQISVFPSCHLAERLPHAGYSRKLIGSSQIEPSQTLYVSCVSGYLAAAQTAGLQTLLYEDEIQCVSDIRKLCSDPTEKGLSFLKSRARRLHLQTSEGKHLMDVYAQLLILEGLNDESLVYLPCGQPPFNWLYDDAEKKVEVFSKPPCTDTNCVGLSTLQHITAERRNHLMDQMLKFRDSDGIILAYFSSKLVRLDLVSAINALALFHEFGRGEEVQETEDWVFKSLRRRAHQHGSHYYPSPDIVLLFVSRLLLKAPNLSPRFQMVLRDCVLERKEAPGNSLSLAARLICAAHCGVRDDAAVRTLVIRQKEDGSWPAGAIYKSPQSGAVCYHQGLTTAWAIQAIREQAAVAIDCF